MQTTQKTLTNIKKVSLIFFIVTTSLHLATNSLINNRLFLKESLIINKTMDIPLLLTGMIYAFASLRLNLTDPEKDHKVLDILLISLIIIALIGLIVINLVIPNRLI